jgi:hypothetical protein
MQRKLFLMFFCFALAGASANAAAQTDLVFPIYVNTNSQNCHMWFSSITLFNPHSSSTTVTFNAFDSTGNAIDSGSVTIPAYATGVYIVRRTAVSWVRGTGSQSVFGDEVLQVINTCSPAPPPGVLGVTEVRTRIDAVPAAIGKSHFVSIGYNADAGTNTGISIVFPAASGTASAGGMLIHRGTDGTVVSQRQIVLPANGQVVGMISDLLPDSLKASPSISGSLEITFDQNVAFDAFLFGVQQVYEEPVFQPIGGAVQ